MKRKFPLLLALVLLCVVPSIAQTQEKESLPELIRRVKPSVVAVITYDAKGEMQMTGSGFFVRPNQVLTNMHVIEGAHRVEIRTLDGKGKTYAVEGLLNADDEGDLALLSVQVPADRARGLEIASSLPEEGEDVFVIGNPLRLEGSISNGIVSAVREVPNLGEIVQITAPISHGNSGSPLFNMKGQVLGIVTMKVTNGQNINLALGASRLAKLKPEKLISFDELAARSKTGAQGEVLAEWWYRNGLNSLWLGNYDSALGYFETAVNKNPARADAWIQVGFCKVKQGKNQDAIRAFEQALKLTPDSYEALNKLADAEYYAGNYYRALDSYKRAVARRPAEPEGYYNLALAYVEIGDRAAALAQARALKALDAELYRKLSAEMER